MSKNFELLQEIGSDEELFRTSDSDIATATLWGAAITSSLEVDKAERERFLRNASLPNVLVPVDDSTASQFSHTAGCLESTESTAVPGPQDDSAMVPTQDGDALAAPSDATAPPTEPFLNHGNQGQTGQNVISGEDDPQAHRSILSLFPPNPESLPEASSTRERIRTSSFGLTWVDVAKAGIRHWI